MKLIDNFALRFKKFEAKRDESLKNRFNKNNPMIKKTAYNSGVLILLVYLFVSVSSISATNNSSYPRLTDEELKYNVINLGGHVDFKFTPEVKQYIQRYTKQGRKSTEKILGKIPVYFPVFEKKIKEKYLPEELKILAIVESHLNVNAYSKVGAAGLWQFMKGTAKQYKLRVQRNYDERYSVEKSTEAALTFLTDLYIEFDDWTLALAAYNCGAGNVRKAIRKSGGHRDFWVIQKYLPRETRNYVPKFIAISYLLKHYKEYNIDPIVPEKVYFETANAKIFKHLTFSKIADVTGLSMDIIKTMNSAYRRNYIPVNTQGYNLTLPKSALFTLLEFENYNQVEFKSNNDFNYSKYVMKNFSREIAMQLLGKSYRLEIKTLSIKNLEYLFDKYRKNRVVKLPPLRLTVSKRILKDEFLYHDLKAGESLMDIAAKYDGVELMDILQWNNIRLSNPPKVGAKLRYRIQK